MTDAPLELTRLGLDRDKFHRAGAKAWRGPCPRCGGNRHLLIFTDNPFPKWNCECQSCGLKAWADMLNKAVKVELTPDQKRAFAQQKAADQQAADKTRRETLAKFTTAELWAELAQRMTADHRAWWVSQGVNEEWQKYLRIGFTPDKIYRGQDDELHHSPAYTIPYFHTDFKFVTLQYRLADAPNPNDRYRFEQGLGTTYYMTQPAAPIGDTVIICEGAKKAIVTAINTPETYTVLAVPSKSDFGGVAEAVKDCGRVYVLLDPDAMFRARKLAKDIGPAARLATLPTKVDDAIVKHGLTGAMLIDALRVARPL